MDINTFYKTVPYKHEHERGMVTLTRTDARTNEGELGPGGGRRGSFAGTYFARLVLFSSTLRVCQQFSVDTSPLPPCLSSRGSTIVPRLTYSVSARVFARQIRKRSAIDYSRPNRETNALCGVVSNVRKENLMRRCESLR